MNSNRPIAELTTPISALRGIGPKRGKEFERAGVKTIEDLLFHMPFRYEDRRHIRQISSLQPGENATVRGRVDRTEVVKTRRRGFTIFEAFLNDGTGELKALWFNQPYLADTILPDYTISLFGKVALPRGRGRGGGGRILEMPNPKFEVGESAEEAGLVPVYERIGKVGGWVVRKLIRDLFEHYRVDLPCVTPVSVLDRNKLMPAREALEKIHMPPQEWDCEELNAGKSVAQRSLVFEEFFMLQVGIAIRKMTVARGTAGIRFKTSDKIRDTLREMLPFRLTAGQKKAFAEIVDDMCGHLPMRRLLQGDVGCGKTIVALLSAALAVENGYQVTLMAPTEVLAEQHLESVRKHLSHTGYRVELLTGSLKPSDKKKVQQRISDGDIDLVVGTHALIQDDIKFKRLGLAVIDEQHRFGVLQRARLMAMGGNPDLLIMTATPIPRSLTLTLFGDLTVSVIRDMPPGRQPIVTAARTERSRPKINAFLEKQMTEGRQIYAVAPVIEESVNDELQTAMDLFDRLVATFPHRRIGLLHGRLPKRQRDEVMEKFSSGELDILACTTVIEVGIDVPNATVMLIENAERFGLAQLHQLRGRVGRGEHKSYCILLYHRLKTEQARDRISIMVKTGDGFRIAEKDLEIRGPGEFFGTKQSGMPALRVGNLVRDVELLQQARKEAFKLILEPGAGDKKERARVIGSVTRFWSARYGLVLVG